MSIILFDDDKRSDLLPLCFTRPCAELRVGILTITEKWQRAFNVECSHLTFDYLTSLYPCIYADENLFINGRLLPDANLVSAINSLEEGQQLKSAETILAFRTTENTQISNISDTHLDIITYSDTYSIIDYTYDIFKLNGEEIRKDFSVLTANRKSAPLSSSNTLIGGEIFVEDGVEVEASVLNSKNGPIYIGKESTIMEGALIKGPFAICLNATVKMGAKIYGDTTIGPHCKVGGEVSNSVFYARSNKGHDGFLGNSVIGEWCNLGADTNSSNLKNNYAEVKLWNYTRSRFLKTGLQFCGLIMADHSKCGINTMFNTGTVVGVSANIFGAAFPRNFIPSFTWGGATGFATYSPAKAFETARIVMKRRNFELTDLDKEILMNIYEESAKHRVWENKPLNT